MRMIYPADRHRLPRVAALQRARLEHVAALDLRAPARVVVQVRGGLGDVFFLADARQPSDAIVALREIADLHENGRTVRKPKYAKVGRVNSTIRGIRDGHEFLLNTVSQIHRRAGMIVGFESVRPALTRVVKMYANKDCIFLLVLDGDAVVERNKHV